MTMESKLRQAAAILMCLPNELSVDIMAKLNPKQVELVSIELAQLGTLDNHDIEDAIVEFAEINPALLGRTSGSLELATSLVKEALGNKAAPALENLRQTVEGMPFGFLKKVDPESLVTFVVDEHPQTIALVLSHLPPAFGSQVISTLDPDKQVSVIRRIANMGQTSPEVIKQVEEELESRMVAVMSQSFENAGGIPSVAEILNVTDRQTERALMDNLGHEDPELVEEIRRRMFIFDDIIKLSDKDMQAVLQAVEVSQWAMSLKGANQEVKDKVFGNMSERAAKMLAEEIDFLGAVRLADVETVQQEVVDAVRRLEETGKITISSGNEEEAFVE